jgi:WD40 repeat protein
MPLTAELVSPAILADFSGDGLRLAARRNEPGDAGLVVGIWDVDSTRPLAVLEGHRFPVFGVRFSADGRRVATFACDRSAPSRPTEVKVWDADTGLLLTGWEGAGALYSLAFSPDGRWLATGKEDGTVEVVDWARGKKVSTRRDHKGAVTALAFSRDGGRLASSAVGDQAVRIVDSATWGRRGQTLAVAPGLLCDLAFTLDGKRLAGISRDAVKLWDVKTGEELLTLRGAPQRQRDPSFNARLTFSPDGRRLAGSNWDESISVWEAEPPDPEYRESRRRAAEQRAALWHLQEAEQCLLAKTIHPFAARFHLRHLGDTPLSAPLRDRKDHVRRWAATR